MLHRYEIKDGAVIVSHFEVIVIRLDGYSVLLSEWMLNRLIHFYSCDTILLFNEMSTSFFFHTFQTEAKFAITFAV